jgi:biotin transport system substrate-specific component
MDRVGAPPAAASEKTLQGIFGAAVFAGLTVVGANIYIPLTPVPVTLQTLFVLLAGAAIGGRYGSLSQFLYVGMGVAGIPVFAGSLGGLAILTGPTGGYLVSFLFVPFVVGALLRRSQAVRWQILAFSVGTALIFAAGLLHLAVFYTSGLSGAIRVGLLPFLPGAIIKIAAATSIFRSYSALRRHFGSRRGTGAATP